MGSRNAPPPETPIDRLRRGKRSPTAWEVSKVRVVVDAVERVRAAVYPFERDEVRQVLQMLAVALDDDALAAALRVLRKGI